MIPLYKEIGEIVLRKEKFEEFPDYEKKLFIVRQYCIELDNFYYTEKQGETIITQWGRLLELNIDTNKKECEFMLGPELIPSNKDELMIFANYAPNDPSIYASHISPKSIFQFELADFIENNFKQISWINSDKALQFLNYLTNIQNTFYKKINNTNFLRYDCIVESQKENFPDPEIIPELFDNIKDKKKFNKLYKQYLNKYISSTLKDLNYKKQAYALRIDGNFLHQGEFADCYIDVLYYYLFERHYKNTKNKGYCHICGNYDALPEDVFIKQKFFGTTNPLYFDKVDNSFTSNAFSMCETCNKKVLTGIQYASSKLNTRLLGLSTIVLPEIEYTSDSLEELIDPERLLKLAKLIERKSINKLIEDLDFIRKLTVKLKSFNLIFYNKPQPNSQEFIINGFIRNISTYSLIQKAEDLRKTVEDYKLGPMYGYVGELSLEGLRYLILPSKESHPGLDDYTSINKDIINLLETYMHNRKFKYKKLITQFVNIFNRKNNNLDNKDFRQSLDITPFFMNLYIKHLIEFNQLEGVPIMEERKIIAVLQDESLSEYFKTHSDIYENNYYAQGLFILGKYISEVEAKQRQKDIKSPLINRLNLRGIPVQKVLSVVAMVDEMRKVWETYYDAVTENYFRECLQGITKSSLLPEEVVFHILAGRAYEDYRRKLYFQEHPNIKNDIQEENNDQE